MGPTRKAYKKSRYKKAATRYFNRVIKKCKPYQHKLTKHYVEKVYENLKEIAQYLTYVPIPFGCVRMKSTAWTMPFIKEIRNRTDGPYHMIVDTINKCGLDEEKVIKYMREQGMASTEEKTYFK